MLVVADITYTLKSKYLITPDERLEAEWLCLKGGFMWKEFLNKEKIGMVILAKNIYDCVVAWGLVFDRNDEKTLFIYTSNNYRRLGIGTKIFQIATDNFGDNIYVSRHDKRAAAFFNNVK